MSLRGKRPCLQWTVLWAVFVMALVGSLATPASASEPSVSYRVSGTNLLTVTGRTAAASPVVRIERRTPSGWVLVKRVRAHGHRFATSVRAAAGTTSTFRVTGARRRSTFRVAMPSSRKPAPAPAPPATTYDACGAQPRKPDGTAWSCTFHDDFDGTALDRTKWLPQVVFSTGSPGAYACYRDDPSVIGVADGSLNLTVRRVSTPVTCEVDGKTVSTNYLAGMVSTYHLFSQQYGRFEARFRNTATTAPGLQEAFWLWPDDRVASTAVWPTAGEIDVSETYSVHPDLSIPFLHYSADAGGPQPGLNTAWDCAAPRGQWNTYALEWSPTRIEITVNGRTCLVNTSGDAAFQKPYIAAFTEALGAAGNEFDGRAPLPATMSIDYLRVWH